MVKLEMYIQSLQFEQIEEVASYSVSSNSSTYSSSRNDVCGDDGGGAGAGTGGSGSSDSTGGNISGYSGVVVVVVK